MATVTIRNLPDETHRALKRRAARNGRSTEAEIRMILTSKVEEGEFGLGSEMAAYARQFGGVDLDGQRDDSAAEAADFE